MKIRIYVCDEPDVPPKHRCVATCFDQSGPLPSRHFGADPEALRAQVQAWWDEQVAKAQAKHGRVAPKKKAADPGDVI